MKNKELKTLWKLAKTFLIAWLAVALFFKLKRFREPKRNVCAIYNRFFRIIKNSKGVYFYEFSDLFSKEYRQFYNGKRLKFINRYFIYLITTLYNIIGIPLLFLCYYPFAYFEGCKNFIKDTGWYENVKFFNWINFILLIILLIRMLLQSYF
jgi:hypothetical protein